MKRPEIRKGENWMKDLSQYSKEQDEYINYLQREKIDFANAISERLDTLQSKVDNLGNRDKK